MVLRNLFISFAHLKTFGQLMFQFNCWYNFFVVIPCSKVVTKITMRKKIKSYIFCRTSSDMRHHGFFKLIVSEKRQMFLGFKYEIIARIHHILLTNWKTYTNILSQQKNRFFFLHFFKNKINKNSEAQIAWKNKNKLRTIRGWNENVKRIISKVKHYDLFTRLQTNTYVYPRLPHKMTLAKFS